MATSQTVVTVSGTKIRETDKAVLFRVHEVSGTPLEEPKTEWFPFSQISRMLYDKNTNEDESVHKDELVIAEWIARKKELI